MFAGQQYETVCVQPCAIRQQSVTETLSDRNLKTVLSCDFGVAIQFYNVKTYSMYNLNRVLQKYARTTFYRS